MMSRWGIQNGTEGVRKMHTPPAQNGTEGGFKMIHKEYIYKEYIIIKNWNF